MNEFEQRQEAEERILDLHQGDPFEVIIREAEVHRAQHGAACGLYPARPHVMRLVATLARAASPMRILDLGTGFGYSALWLASACETSARIEAIDRFPEHVARAREFAKYAGHSSRIEFIAGEVVDVLAQLQKPYDLVHDDAWFAREPLYLERMLELLRPGGLLTMPNWFLLEDAIRAEPRRDWSEFAGPDWRDVTLEYAKRLARDPRLFVSWCLSPPLAIAVKQG